MSARVILICSSRPLCSLSWISTGLQIVLVIVNFKPVDITPLRSCSLVNECVIWLQFL